MPLSPEALRVLFPGLSANDAAILTGGGELERALPTWTDIANKSVSDKSTRMSVERRAVWTWSEVFHAYDEANKRLARERDKADREDAT